MTLGEKIYALRMREGLSQEAFGEKLGVSRQSVSKWETDQSVPELDKIVMISDLFAVSTDYLLKESAMEEQWTLQQEPSGTEQDTNTVKAREIVKQGFSYEYKSKICWRGLPLVHVNLGFGRRAKGVIAIGLTAKGDRCHRIGCPGCDYGGADWNRSSSFCRGSSDRRYRAGRIRIWHCGHGRCLRGPFFYGCTGGGAI